MKVRMKVSSAGPAGMRLEGQTYDVDGDEARDLIASGYATAVDVAPETADAAMAPEDETAGSNGEAATQPPAPDEATAPPQRKRKGR